MNPNKRYRARKGNGSTAGQSTSRPTLSERMAVGLDIPADILDGGIRLEMRGRHTLLVHGCQRIEGFSPERVTLRLKKCILTVCGCRLICTSYLAGAVGIEGCITCISFADGEVEA